jgi:hypothetical protein
MQEHPAAGSHGQLRVHRIAQFFEIRQGARIHVRAAASETQNQVVAADAASIVAIRDESPNTLGDSEN